jgi:hypothetical protein
VDNALYIEWKNDEWRSWKELTQDPKFIQLQAEAEGKLKRAKDHAGKGKGRVA